MQSFYDITHAHACAQDTHIELWTPGPDRLKQFSPSGKLVYVVVMVGEGLLGKLTPQNSKLK